MKQNLNFAKSPVPFVVLEVNNGDEYGIQLGGGFVPLSYTGVEIYKALLRNIELTQQLLWIIDSMERGKLITSKQNETIERAREILKTGSV